MTSRPACVKIYSMENYDDIIALSERYNIHAEYASADFYPRFRSRMQGLRLLLLSDENTVRYAAPLQQKLCEAGLDAHGFTLPFYEPVADEKTCALLSERLSDFDYVLAVGAGTLNDIAK